MMKFYKQIRSNEKGFTLIEVLASFVILVILLTSFFTFFIQTAKTGKNSENIVDATYIAQGEMEEIHNKTKGVLSKNLAIINLINTQDPRDSPYEQDIDNDLILNKKTGKFTIKLTLKENHYSSNLTNAVIEVYESNDKNLETIGNKHKAIMENVFPWKWSD
ncbi:type IV pilus modification PilV family protein [Viridibacillus arvi]|uniref:type IV pilus modification PilV family protein n=1 Tax=Viridibacillus arvi TaxID=263475 RepID=UPI003CFED071